MDWTKTSALTAGPAYQQKALKEQCRENIPSFGTTISPANGRRAGIWYDPTTSQRQPQNGPFMAQGLNPNHKRQIEPLHLTGLMANIAQPQ